MLSHVHKFILQYVLWIYVYWSRDITTDNESTFFYISIQPNIICYASLAHHFLKNDEGWKLIIKHGERIYSTHDSGLVKFDDSTASGSLPIRNILAITRNQLPQVLTLPAAILDSTIKSISRRSRLSPASYTRAWAVRKYQIERSEISLQIFQIIPM